MSPSADIIVTAADRLTWRGRAYRCAIGRGGFAADKAEGDGATPLGRFLLRRVFYRPDRLARPETALGTVALGPDDGWCDDPAHADYNRPVSLPFAAGHERLWRDDGLYDVIVELGYNDAPVVPGRGSAIFFHVAAPDWAPTAGCVAVRRDDLLRILGECGPETWIDVNPDPG